MIRGPELEAQQQAGFIEGLEARAQEFLSERHRLVGAFLGILAIVQVDALVLVGREEPTTEAAVSNIVCVSTACEPEPEGVILPGDQRFPMKAVRSTSPSAQESPTTTTATTTTIQEVVPATVVSPTPEVIYHAMADSRNELAMAPINSETEARIEAVQLSVEGYQNFLASIDTSLIDYSRQYAEFDPGRNGFRQDQRIEWVTVHHTANYANTTGIATVPEGEVNPRVLIDMMATRGDEEGDHMCCAVQFFNDRNGKMWQFTSRTARVRHDKRFEEVSIGLETEGIDESFTTRQFENIAYWSIAMTNAEALLGTAPLDRIVRGHEETRDEWNANHPTDQQPMKQDGDAAIMDRVRSKIAEFLNQHPEVKDIAVTIN